MTDAPAWASEWNLTIKRMPLPMYLDWRKAGRPGFNPMDNLKLQSWCRTWKIAHHQGRAA